FNALPNVTAGSKPSGIVVLDLSGDGLADFATANEGGSVTIFANTGQGGFLAAGSPIALQGEPTGIAAADVDGVNGADLVVAQPNTSSLTVLINNGQAAFNSQSVIPL